MTTGDSESQANPPPPPELPPSPFEEAAAPTPPPPPPPPAMTSPPAATSSGTPGPLAEWVDRVVAALIDAAIVLAGYVAVFVVYLLLRAVSRGMAGVFLGLVYLAATFVGFYFAYLNGAKGQTPGKAMTGLKVVRETDGQLIGGGMGVVRSIAHALDGICLIGYLFPLWDPKKQTFADKLLTTVVIKGEPKKSFSVDLFKPN